MKFNIGDKVVPRAFTSVNSWGYQEMLKIPTWKRTIESGQKYLYVIEIIEDILFCSDVMAIKGDIKFSIHRSFMEYELIKYKSILEDV